MLNSQEIADARKYARLPNMTAQGIAAIIAPRQPQKHDSIVRYVMEARRG